MTDAQTQALRLITNELKNLSVRSPKPDSEVSSTLKLPTIKLPNLKKSDSGVVTARTYYTWKSTLCQIMRHHKMSSKALHTHYSTSVDLPKQYAEAFQNSRDLRSALESLDAQFPPLSSVHSDLVQQLLNFPALNRPTETQRVTRSNQIIAILEDLKRFFSDDESKDLNRQQCLVILSNM